MFISVTGQTHKDIHTGALAAAAGGLTVVMIANTNPTISDKGNLGGGLDFGS